MKLSLRTRLIILSIVVVTIAMLALTTANFLTVQRHVIATVDAQSQQLAATQANTLAEWVADKRLLTHALAQAIDLPKPQAQTIVQALRDGGGFSDAYIGYADKRIVFLREMPASYAATERPWYIQAVQAGQPILTAPYMFATEKKLGVTFAEPVGPAGNPVAVVGADVLLTSVVRTVNAIKPTPGSFAFLADRQGLILAHADAALTLKPASTLSASLTPALLQEASQSDADIQVSIDNTDYLLYSHAIAGTDWQLVIAVNRSQALASIGTLLKVSALTVVIALALAIALLGWVITRALQRLNQVRDALDDIAQGDGDLSRRLDASGHDELASIAGAFNRFTGKIAAALRDIRSTSHSVRLSAAEIAQGNLSLSNRTEAQASSLEQTSAAMEELTATVRQNADNARSADSLASQAAEAAASGGATVHKVVETMQAIDSSSSRVADIVGVIDGIAFQTNILALNAAVEAARAGDQGRGFAVVATEVRALAQRSASAAKEIKTLIEESVERVRAGSALVSEAGQQIDGLVTGVERVRTIVGEISVASQEQTQGISEVALAVSQMDQATQQNAAQVEEVTAAAQSLSEEASQLDEVVARFTLDAQEDGHRHVFRGEASVTNA